MSIWSEAFPIEVKGRKGELRVIRNSGYCWGRVEWSDGEVEEVETARDYYDHEDGTAAKAFERKLRRQ